MCGIAGRIADRPLEPDRLNPALARMANRGPDGTGHHAGTRVDGRAYDLLHSRLSIIDLNERSDQPFRRDGLTLIYNGEIYNYRELRSELQGRGHHFRTEGDTEVLLIAWKEWGTGALDRLVGMFAFAILDDATGAITIARDRFGEKPLYLWMNAGEDNAFLFASEIKVLAAMAGATPAPDLDQLRRYLVNGYKGLMRANRTFFAGVRELPAAHYLELVPGREAGTPVRYWQLGYSPVEMTAQEASTRVEAALTTAMERTLRADVPVAVRLSGGIDSNVIAGISHHRLHADITCFSIIEDDWRYDESAMIKKGLAALGVENHQIRIPKDGFLDRLSDMIAYFDGPPLTISYYLHYLVSQAIHDHGFRLSLGGTGADEVFSGYYDHYLFWLAEMKDAADFDDLVSDWRRTYGQFVRNPFLQSPRVFIETPNARDHIFLGADRFSRYLTEPFDEPHREAAFTPAILRNRMMNELAVETVPVMLHDDDLASMRWSVENRAPYLDRDLVECVSRIPTRHLIADGLPKALLRKAGKGIAPDVIMSNPRKQGINAPVTSMIDFTNPDVRDRLLADGAFFDLVDRSRFEELIGSDVSLNSESKFLFSLLATRLFLDQLAAQSGG